MTFDEALTTIRTQYRKLTEPLAGIVSLTADIVDRGLSDARKTKRLRDAYGRAWESLCAVQAAHQEPGEDHGICDVCDGLGDEFTKIEDELLQHLRSLP